MESSGFWKAKLNFKLYYFASLFCFAFYLAFNKEIYKISNGFM